MFLHVVDQTGKPVSIPVCKIDILELDDNGKAVAIVGGLRIPTDMPIEKVEEKIEFDRFKFEAVNRP